MTNKPGVRSHVPAAPGTGNCATLLLPHLPVILILHMVESREAGKSQAEAENDETPDMPGKKEEFQWIFIQQQQTPNMTFCIIPSGTLITVSTVLHLSFDSHLQTPSCISSSGVKGKTVRNCTFHY